MDFAFGRVCRFGLSIAATACGVLAFAASAAAQPAAPITFSGGNSGQGAARNAPVTVAAVDTAALADTPRWSASAEPAPSRAARTTQATQPWLERERVGPPYQANGQWYVPTPEPGYSETGMASWYGPTFHGRATATGETFDQEAMTAAHPTLPIPSLVQVTNLENGREIIVRVNDRGPFVGGRLIDLSRRAAEVLGYETAGQARVHVRYLGPAPRRVNPDRTQAALAVQQPAVQQPARMQPAAYQPTALEPAPVAAAPASGPTSLLPPPRMATPAELTRAADGGAVSPSLAQITAAPRTPPVAAAVGDYFVQIGAYADLANAQHVRDAVGSAGPVSVDVRDTARGELFRVRLGPYSSRAEAEQARVSLARLGHRDAILAAR